MANETTITVIRLANAFACYYNNSRRARPVEIEQLYEVWSKNFAQPDLRNDVWHHSLTIISGGRYMRKVNKGGL